MMPADHPVRLNQARPFPRFIVPVPVPVPARLLQNRDDINDDVRSRVDAFDSPSKAS